MAFWSSQSLESGLQVLVGHNDRSVVDCNSITLRVGNEIYISPTLTDPSPATHTLKSLDTREGFTIPPGQFGFILTAETIHLPADVMGFISIKATYKLMGLINVSGFHVDPGFEGQLTYSVFNAGPAPIHIREGVPLFLLWIADLDDVSHKHKTKALEAGISSDMVNRITGAVGSVADVEKKINDRIDALAADNNALRDELLEVERSVRTRQAELTVGQAVSRMLWNMMASILLLAAGVLLAPIVDDLWTRLTG